MVDCRDMLIDDLAYSEAALLARVADLEAERESYRLLAQQAIHALHNLTRSHDRLREQHARTLDEYRALRDNTMRQAMAA